MGMMPDYFDFWGFFLFFVTFWLITSSIFNLVSWIWHMLCRWKTFTTWKTFKGHNTSLKVKRGQKLTKMGFVMLFLPRISSYSIDDMLMVLMWDIYCLWGVQDMCIISRSWPWIQDQIRVTTLKLRAYCRNGNMLYRHKWCCFFYLVVW